ncbi:hypothetical protein [Nocardioides gansuensis]|nr:hypothetical protein [Nocardioides gansuensis]
MERLLVLNCLLTAPRRRDERGDVPGWVMITVMTVALAVGIWTFAKQPLNDLLSAAFGRAGQVQ